MHRLKCQRDPVGGFSGTVASPFPRRDSIVPRQVATSDFATGM